MIPPYQTAAEETRRQAGAPIKTAAAIGTSVIGGSAALKKILPFLNKLIPGELMRKGLSKISPDIGRFINSALNNGYNLDDIRNFMNDKFSQEFQEKKQENPLQEFETNYPDIAQALSGYINQGQSPDAAAAILKNSSSFRNKIGKLEKDTGKNFVDYVLELFGGSQQQMQQQQAQIQQPQPQQQAQIQQPSQSQQPPQGGNNDELLAALDRILKM